MKVRPADIDEIYRILEKYKSGSDEFVYAFTRLLIKIYDRGQREITKSDSRDGETGHEW